MKSRFSNTEKTKAVLRILAGEDIHAVAVDLQITFERIERWRSAFLAGGEAAIEKQSEERHSSHHGVLSKKTKSVILQWAGVLLVLVIVIYLMNRTLNQSTGQ